MPLRHLILLRHGETEFNRARRMQGHLDVALSERGRAQADRVAPVLARTNPLAIISSDAQRAVHTAQAVSDLCDVPVHLDTRLRETDMGEWTGLDQQEVEDHWPGDRPKWRSDPTYAPPGGENRLEVARRAMDVVRDLHRDLTSWGEDERPVLLVAHGGIFLALAAALIDSPLQNYAAFSALGNTSWSQFTEWPQYFVEADLDAHPAAAGPRIPAIPPIQPGYQWRVDVWNSTTHLGSDAF